MREQSPVRNITVDNPFDAMPETGNADLGVALVRVDHINPAPVPLLEVDGPLTILVIACDNQSATSACKIRREIQALLESHRFYHTLASFSLSHSHHLTNWVVVQSKCYRRPRFVRHVQSGSAARYSYDPGASPACELC